MVQLLVDHGADPDQGVYPRREATSARVLASDRGYAEISEIFAAKDEAQRQEARCPNLTVTSAITELADLVKNGKDDAVMERIATDASLVDSCDEQGETVVHHTARWGRGGLMERLIGAGVYLSKMNVDGIRALDIAVRMPGSFDLKKECAAIVDVLAYRDSASAQRGSVKSTGELTIGQLTPWSRHRATASGSAVVTLPRSYGVTGSHADVDAVIAERFHRLTQFGGGPFSEKLGIEDDLHGDYPMSAVAAREAQSQKKPGKVPMAITRAVVATATARAGKRRWIGAEVAGSTI